jgi:beta-xylosidase
MLSQDPLTPPEPALLARRALRLPLLAALVALLAAGLATPAAAYPGAPWFEPDKPYTENFPDPDVLRVGSTYYAYGTSTGGAYLPVMRSTDLRTWTARSAYDPRATTTRTSTTRCRSRPRGGSRSARAAA